MTNLKHILGTLFVSALIFTSCSTKEENDTEIIIPATAAEFKNIQDDALEGLTQTFQFDAADGSITLTSENGEWTWIYLRPPRHWWPRAIR